MGPYRGELIIGLIYLVDLRSELTRFQSICIENLARRLPDCCQVLQKIEWAKFNANPGSVLDAIQQLISALTRLDM